MEDCSLGSQLLVYLIGLAPEQLYRHLRAAPLRFAHGGGSALAHVSGAHAERAFAASACDV